MPILTLLGVVVVTLAGAATLALRVVRVPRSESRRAPAPGGSRGMPANTLQARMAAEHQRHTIALREALNLRRARNDYEAQTRLLNERVRHAVAARDLARRIRPSSGGLLRRWMSQAWMDMYVERVRREVGAVRVPGQTRPLTRERALRRLVVWVRGGPRVGYASDLVEYHRAQRAHYRLAKVSAARLARDGRHDEAMTQLWNEQDFHMRVAHDLGEMFGAPSGPGPSPLATRPLAPLAPQAQPLPLPAPEPVAP